MTHDPDRIARDEAVEDDVDESQTPDVVPDGHDAEQEAIAVLGPEGADFGDEGDDEPIEPEGPES
jgi:hypothetical protein